MQESYQQYTTDSPITLELVLQKLAIRISQTSSPLKNSETRLDKVSLLIKLLKRIDHSYFDKKFLKTSDYQFLLKTICDYYSEKKEEEIKKLFIIQSTYKNKFIHIFQLVMDLAINSFEKENYLNEIIRMQEREKQLLMAYIDEVIKRKFIQKQGDMYDSLLEIKEQEYQELRQSFEQIYRNYYELLENHNSMKVLFERLQKQNNQLLKQKQDLMNELGLQGSHSFVEVAQKYHDDIQDYQIFIEKLTKQLQSKIKSLKVKDEQMQEMTASLSNLGQSSAEVESLIIKNKGLEDALIDLFEKQSKAKQEIDKNSILISALRKEIQEKDFQIIELSRIKEKYTRIKEAHGMFKRNFYLKLGHDNQLI